MKDRTDQISQGAKNALSAHPPSRRQSTHLWLSYFSLLAMAFLLIASPARAEEIGTRKVLAIRINFPDMAGAPSFSTVQSRQNGAKNNFESFSYGKLILKPTVTTEVFTMPHNKAYYDNSGGAMATSAENKARAAGYAVGSFDKIGYYYLSGSGLGSHATVGGKGFWVQGSTGGSTQHEMGHTFGWGHARRWASDDATKPLSSKGEVKTADYHFMSGGSYDPTPYEKWGRGWITKRKNITSDGSYPVRLYTFDQKNTSPTLALRTIRVTRKNFTQEFWLGYRSQLLNNVSKTGKNTSLQQGLVLYWQRSAGSQAVMVDVHSGGGQDNHSIQPGETFSDTAGKIHFTNLGRGGNKPNEYLDVVINRGSFTGNQAPAPTWDAPTTAEIGAPFTITVAGNDPDGDEVACTWSPKLASPNATGATTRTFTFNSAGYYTLKATVSDMKGKTANLSQSIVVRSATATTRIWDRGAGNNKWHTATNWTQNTKPVGDDTVAFDGRTATNLTIALDKAATVFDILYSGTETHNIQADTGGNRKLTVAGNITNNATANQIFRRNASNGKLLNVSLSANDHIIDTGAGGITVMTQITGADANLIKEGEGTLTFQSWTGNTPVNAANTYSGMTTINAGTLALDKNAGIKAISGNLTIGDGQGIDILRLDNNNQILDSSVIAFNGSSSAVFRLNGFEETVGGVYSLTRGAGFIENGSPDTASVLTVDLLYDADGDFGGLLRDGGGASLGLVKAGSGAMTLSAANTYSGGTEVTSGTLLISNTTGSATGSGAVQILNTAVLGGNGFIGGPVTIGANAALSPGDAETTGTLSFSDTLSLAGTTQMEIHRENASLSSDRIEMAGALTYSGSLVVSDIGHEPLALGDRFTLFQAPSYSGSFVNIQLPSLEPGLFWSRSNLAVNGSIEVVDNARADVGGDWILYE